MADIKTKDLIKKDIKVLNKAVVGTEKLKDNLVATKQKVSNDINTKESAYETGSDTIIGTSEYVSNKIVKEVPKTGSKNVKTTKENIVKAKEKLKVIKEKGSLKKEAKTIKSTGKGIKNTTKGIKDSKKVAKDAQKVAQKSAKNARRSYQMAKEATRRTIQTTKAAIKATISTIKLAIAGTKALISALIAGGWVVLVIVVVICMIGLLCSSIFGIFFSSESGTGTRSMSSVVLETNKDMAKKITEIQDKNQYDEFVIVSNRADWKDVLAIYSAKVSNGHMGTDVMTIDDNKVKILKQVFWDMNQITHEIKTEQVQNNEETELSKKTKKVLYITISSKTKEEMMTKYMFSPMQKIQVNDLLSDEYKDLWNSVIYGANSGDFVNWRQTNPQWSSIKVGNSNKTMGNIGCLITSISILIDKSGTNIAIDPFNPGTFLEALNKTNGFDNEGSLQYAAVNRAVPNFEYVDRVMLTGKTKEEKYNIISSYHNKGYYLAVEVKGDTGQHWVAVMEAIDGTVSIVDPSSNSTDLWTKYDYKNTSQFVYFRVK